MRVWSSSKAWHPIRNVEVLCSIRVIIKILYFNYLTRVSPTERNGGSNAYRWLESGWCSSREDLPRSACISSTVIHWVGSSEILGLSIARAKTRLYKRLLRIAGAVLWERQRVYHHFLPWMGLFDPGHDICTVYTRHTEGTGPYSGSF